MIFTLILYIYYTHQTHHPYVYIHHQHLASVQGSLPGLPCYGRVNCATRRPEANQHLHTTQSPIYSRVIMQHPYLFKPPCRPHCQQDLGTSKSHTNTINTWYISTQTHKSYMVYTYKHNNTSILGFWVHIYFQRGAN